MEIELLYVSDCPNRTTARDHLQKALEQVRLATAVLHEREVGSSDEAVQLGMRGSPTILVDGRDPFGDDEQPVSLSCRLYPSEAGMNGAPSIEELVAVLPDDSGRERQATHGGP